MNFVTPFILPKVQGSIHRLFSEHGHTIHLKKGELVADTHKCLQNTYYVYHGTISQSYVNNCVNKCYLMSVLPKGGVGGGYLNLFSDIKKPCYMSAIQKSTLFVINNDEIKETLKNDPKLYDDFVNYYAISHDTTIKTLASILYFSVEERLKILFMALLYSKGINFDTIKDDKWVKIPYMLRREDIVNMTYSSTSVVNNILSQWNKIDYTKRECCKDFYIRPHVLENAYKWICENFIFE